MVDDAHDVNGDDDKKSEDPGQKKVVKHDRGAADLEKVTDYAEETEIDTDNNDEFKGAMTMIGDRRNQEAADKIAKEKELLKVAILKEDVDLIVSEFEISRPKAERILREHHGNIVEALTSLAS